MTLYSSILLSSFYYNLLPDPGTGTATIVSDHTRGIVTGRVARDHVREDRVVHDRVHAIGDAKKRDSLP